MNEKALLLSITPEYADKIADGSKTIELRRRFPSLPVGTWIYFYATLPVGAVRGRARVADIDVSNPNQLWDKYRDKVGISRERFRSYFRDCETGTAVALVDYESIGPITLAQLRANIVDFVVPQSYRYLTADIRNCFAELGNGDQY